MGVLDGINTKLPQAVYEGVDAYVFESSRDPSILHVTVVTPDGEVLLCSCPGFRGHGYCWHKTQVMVDEAYAAADNE